MKKSEKVEALHSDFLRHSLIVPLGASVRKPCSQKREFPRRRVPLFLIHPVLRHTQRPKKSAPDILSGRRNRLPSLNDSVRLNPRMSLFPSSSDFKFVISYHFTEL